LFDSYLILNPSHAKINDWMSEVLKGWQCLVRFHEFSEYSSVINNKTGVGETGESNDRPEYLTEAKILELSHKPYIA